MPLCGDSVAERGEAPAVGMLKQWESQWGEKSYLSTSYKAFCCFRFGGERVQGDSLEKSYEMLATSVSLGGRGPVGFFLGLCTLSSPEKQKCAQLKASAEGRLFGEKVSLGDGWLHQDHPSPNLSDVTGCVSPERLSQPFLNQHVTGT